MATAGGAAVSPFIVVPLFFPFIVEINCVQLRRLPNLFALTRNYIEAHCK